MDLSNHIQAGSGKAIAPLLVSVSRQIIPISLGFICLSCSKVPKPFYIHSPSRVYTCIEKSQEVASATLSNDHAPADWQLLQKVFEKDDELIQDLDD